MSILDELAAEAAEEQKQDQSAGDWPNERGQPRQLTTTHGPR